VGFVDNRGVRIAYEVHGAPSPATPLVLVHAFPLSRAMWNRVTGELAAARQVVTVDLRGFGESDVAADGAMDRMAQDVRAVVMAESLGRVAVAGLSMGGYVSMAYLRRYPLDVAALVLANTRAAGDSDVARRGRLALIEQIRKGGTIAAVEALMPKLLAPEANSERIELVDEVRAMAMAARPEGVIAALTGMAIRSDSTDLLAAVSMPYLVIAGTRDALIPYEDQARMAAAIEGAELVSIEGAGHLSSLENPEAFVSAIVGFMERVDAL
jgi:pimeloyl-ACP methyl ester carboxylesterase